MNAKKVCIIGGGVSGLSVGSYLQMNGYETRIFESHIVPGGLCTSWKRKGYTFDGCVHWMLGSAPGNAFHDVWSELIDLNDMDFVNHEVRVTIETRDNCNRFGSNMFSLYTDLDVLKGYMTDISPKDERTIQKFIGAVRQMQTRALPPLIGKAQALWSLTDKISLVPYLPMMGRISKWSGITNKDFAKRLKDPFLREVFELFFEGDEHTLLIIMLQLAYFDMKSCGYPIGGSMEIARRLEERYVSLGGEIEYGSTVAEVIVEDGLAVGVGTENGETFQSDWVVSACDWKETIFDLLNGEYTDERIDTLLSGEGLKVFGSAVYLSYGVAKSFAGMPHLLRFPIERRLELPDGTEFDRMEVHLYNYDATLAPEGKTVLTVTLPTDRFEFWEQLRKGNREEYNRVKESIRLEVLNRMEKRLGSLAPYVEACDVATPATYFRYTKNWKGSIQGWFPPKKIFSVKPFPKTLPGLGNFMMFSHWTEPGGGLPIAARHARETAQLICHEDGKDFAANRLDEPMEEKA